MQVLFIKAAHKSGGIMQQRCSSVCLFVCLSVVCEICEIIRYMSTPGASGAYRIDPYTLVSLSCLVVL